MRDLQSLSGIWRGTAHHANVKSSLAADLTFRRGVISGRGRDKDGAFRVKGCYWASSGEVSMVKKYRFHSVTLRGLWNGEFLAGSCTFRFLFLRDEGTFEMWPEVDEKGLGLESLMGEAVS